MKTITITEELLDALSFILEARKIYEQSYKDKQDALKDTDAAFETLQMRKREMFDLVKSDPWYAEINDVTYCITKSTNSHTANVETIRVDKEE